MVVCKLVRIRNTSSRTFYFVHSGDPWYTPRIDGESYSTGPFEVPPGFNAAVEDLVIPWAAVSALFAELAFGEVGLPGLVKCVVGPGLQDCGDIDFVRLHTSTWEALLQDLWLPLGYRGLRGAVAPVDVELVFFDKPQDSGATADGGATANSGASAESGGDGIEVLESLSIADSMRFEHSLSSVSPNTILLNVFDLAAATATLNAMFCNSLVKSVGAFHAAVEVYGKEFSFYQSGRGDPDACGICRSAHPRQHPHHLYRQSVVMGTTDLNDRQVMQVILGMADEWPARRYSIIRCNCIHFCHELLQRLNVGPVPRWVSGLHEIGEAVIPGGSPKVEERVVPDDDDFFWAPAGFTPVEEGRGLGVKFTESKSAFTETDALTGTR